MATYHLHARTISRGGRSTAGGTYRYICRQGKYARKGDLIHVSSGHMPAWAADDPASYWRAADLYERANGRLCKSLNFALPREMGEAVAVQIAQQLAHMYATADGEALPYTLAVHRGRNGNWHGHFIMSERITDGVERTPQEHFARAAPVPKPGQKPKKGGARKTTKTRPKAWLLWIRQTLAEVTNAYYQRAGLPYRVDYRSYADRGVDAIPQQHLGPKLAAIAAKQGIDGEGLAVERVTRNAVIGVMRRRQTTNQDAVRQTVEIREMDKYTVSDDRNGLQSAEKLEDDLHTPRR